MPELPEGPVTIMFTDIEGSTALRTSLGDAETDTLFKQHDEILLNEIEANRGHDQRAALGDGFLAVFVSTRRAIAAAVGIQRALDSFNRTRAGAPLRVRIGLNTGEVAWQDGQLSGEAVHAASRVCAAASGGQILVSDVTRQLAGTVPDLSFLDTGEHDLKGFPQPWRLWEVIWVRETSQVPEQVFVGREQELAMLRTKLNAALDGRGGMVLVGGEPGVGKTTLVRQLIREAEKRGGLAVFGRCYESEGTVPYSPFVEMLEAGLAIMPAEIVREDMGEDAPEVARMVPELRRRFPDIPEPLDLPPEQQRRYFFNAVAAFIGRAAARFPLVLVMDDVHWADEPTLLLIEHMAALMPEMRVLGVGTYRDVELDVSRPLAATLERMVRGRTVERLPVKRFNRDTVATMIEALACRAAPAAVVDAIFDETEGNPFFVEEVFRHLVEEGKVFDEAGKFRSDMKVDELDVPESVRLVVGRRLERLGPEAQKALAAGAVVGRGFPFSLLEDITDIDAGRLLDIVEEAEAARVIVPEERDGEVHYAFAHELIRQTLLTGISLLRRQRMHLSVANALERLDPKARETRPSEIANHLLQAGAAAEADRTLDYLERAADRAMESAAFEEALRSIEDALTVVHDEGARVALQEKLGWAQRALGRFDDCLATWDAVVEKRLTMGEDERAAQLCHEMAYQLGWLGRLPETFLTNQRGLEIIGDRNVSTRARLLNRTGVFLGFTGMLEQADEYSAEAEKIARDLDDDVALGELYWGRAGALFVHVRFREAVEAGRAAVTHLEEAGDLWSLCDAKGWLALALAFSGDSKNALALAKEGRELAVRLGHYGAQILLGRAESLDPGGRGDLDAYERLARRDLDLCKSINSPWIAQSYSWVAFAAELGGRIDEALELHDRAVPLEPLSAFTGFTASGRLINRAYAGATGEFLDRLAEAEEAIAGRTDPLQIGAASVTAGAAIGAGMLGLSEEAARFYPQAAWQAEQAPVMSFGSILQQRAAGMAAAAAGMWDESDSHFERALKDAEALPLRIDEPQVLHWYGKMLGDSGRDRERGRELVGRAVEGYRHMGMPVLLASADELLKSL